MPTLAELAGENAGPKLNGGLDGISMVPALLGEKQHETHAALYFEFHEGGGKQAVIIDGRWKVLRLKCKKNPKGPVQVYDLLADEPEATDLATFPSGHRCQGHRPDERVARRKRGPCGLELWQKKGKDK